jgi:hypothetical protein
MKWERFGDKYLDGLEIMKAMDIPLGEVSPVARVQKHKSWEEFIDSAPPRTQGKNNRTNKKT